MKPYFNWLPSKIIKKIFNLIIQYTRTPVSTILKKNFKSPFPAFNIKRRHEPVATDTIYSNTPATDDGSTSAQIFVGTKTLVTDIYSIKYDKEYINTLEDNIRKRGAMDCFIMTHDSTVILIDRQTNLFYIFSPLPLMLTYILILHFLPLNYIFTTEIIPSSTSLIKSNTHG